MVDLAIKQHEIVTGNGKPVLTEGQYKCAQLRRQTSDHS